MILIHLFRVGVFKLWGVTTSSKGREQLITHSIDSFNENVLSLHSIWVKNGTFGR